MSSYRALGVLIGVVLVAAVATVIVKGGDQTASAPSAQAPTPEPSTTLTFTGAPPFLTESPVITPAGSGSVAGAETSAGATLPRTGGGSLAPQAALLLLLAVAGGWSVWRTARRPTS